MRLTNGLLNLINQRPDKFLEGAFLNNNSVDVFVVRTKKRLTEFFGQAIQQTTVRLFAFFVGAPRVP
jgi:hypothetical protein